MFFKNLSVLKSVHSALYKVQCTGACRAKTAPYSYLLTMLNSTDCKSGVKSCTFRSPHKFFVIMSELRDDCLITIRRSVKKSEGMSRRFVFEQDIDPKVQICFACLTLYYRVFTLVTFRCRWEVLTQHGFI